MINTSDVRVFGYPASSVPRVDYAELRHGGSVTLQPADPDATFAAERAVDGWSVDDARSEGTGDQVLDLDLLRPVTIERIRIVSPTGDDVAGAALEILVDGGHWQVLATLANQADQAFDLDALRLISAVRLRRSDAVLSISEIDVLAPAVY